MFARPCLLAIILLRSSLHVIFSIGLDEKSIFLLSALFLIRLIDLFLKFFVLEKLAMYKYPAVILYA
ncbi:hypothetical protein DERP_012106 [Dermatophagoides pteronyssinus]|uniref:Uncharacterized protein n=1 Tax=Dermatophagoides pteronyssinus TaxID=6956 RepID=A0ABQ8ITZ8_DERPT|nr:hypothetical protein DERP_012106 [Dermatophagoides pteronyssinus]